MIISTKSMFLFYFFFSKFSEAELNDVNSRLGPSRNSKDKDGKNMKNKYGSKH